MLQPAGEDQQVSGLRRKGDAHARAHPGQVDLWSFIHCDDWATRIVEGDLSAFHVRRNLHVIDGRKETPGMTVAHIGISRTVDVDPALQPEAVLLSRCFGSEMIE